MALNNCAIAYNLESQLQQNRNGYLLQVRSEEHTSELQSHSDLVCRLLLEKKKKNKKNTKPKQTKNNKKKKKKIQWNITQ